MPRSTQRSTRSASSLANKRNDSNDGTVNCSQAKSPHPESGFSDVDFNALSSEEIISAMLERNTDPVIEKMILALRNKLPQEIRDGVEAEKRGRSIVISGLEEWGMDKPLLERHKHLEERVADILDALNVDCVPEVTYRMGKYNDLKPRLVKIVLPSRTHWALALSNAHLLRRTQFANIYVRKSMTSAERAREYELRQQARSRNEGKQSREWVVYRGELVHVSNIPRKHIQGNL